MEDSVGRIIAGVFGVLLLFYLPILCLSIKKDNTAQAYMDNAVVEFVDNARATGKITDESYENLCAKIDAAQPCCEIQIVHSVKYTVPTDDSGYETCYYDKQKDEILEDIYTKTGDNKPYYLRHGDFIQVKVKNTKPTLATKIYRLILPNYNPDNVTLFTCYSGYVGNNPE